MNGIWCELMQSGKLRKLSGKTAHVGQKGKATLWTDGVKIQLELLFFKTSFYLNESGEK